MLKGFKDFILKGNVVELATAVIIGAAFTGIVTAFTDHIINPLIATIPSGADTSGFGFQITDDAATFVDFGTVISAAINFIIVAAVVYFIIIVPYNKLSELGGYGKKAEVTEVSLLTEIRDLLADDDDTSAAKAAAQADLPAELSDPSGPPAGGAGGPSGATSVMQRPMAPPAPQQPPAPPQGFPQGQAPQGQPPQGQPPQAPPAGGYGTPTPAPGQYPPQGNVPPQYPNDPNAPGRHSR